MNFRTDISFLRAIAVLIVMLFHFKISGFEGGFIGVDIFFVISGYLMTSITLKSFKENRFSLKDFYIRRIKRLFPALLVVLCFVIIVSVLLLTELDRRSTVRTVFFSDIFLSNVLYWKLEDYFSSTTNLLLHTWSLGVEWQFYIVYPVILLLAAKISQNKYKIFWLINILITVISFVIMLLISDTNFKFFMLPARYWELSIGGVAFLLSDKIKLPHRVNKTIVIFAIAMIIGSAYLINETMPWPSSITVVPVFATVLVLICNVSLRFFDMRIIRYLGDISYSLYLWHWPWFVLFVYFDLLSNPFNILFVFVLSILSATVSHSMVEKNKLFLNLKLNLFLVGTIALVSGLIYLKPEAVTPLSIYNNEKWEVGDFAGKYKRSGLRAKQFNPCNCFVDNIPLEKNYSKDKCLSFSKDKKNVFLLGDSHSAQFSASLRKYDQYNLLEASIAGSLPVLNSNGRSGFKEFNNYIFNEFIPENRNKIDLVVISAHWLMRLDKNINYTEEELLIKIKETVKYLEDQKINYLIIGQTEKYNLPFPKVMVFKNFGKQEEDYLHKLNQIFAIKMKTVIPEGKFLDVYNDSRIIHYDSVNKIPYMFDDNHLTSFGADQIVDVLIAPRILNVLEKKNIQ